MHYSDVLPLFLSGEWREWWCSEGCRWVHRIHHVQVWCCLSSPVFPSHQRSLLSRPALHHKRTSRFQNACQRLINQPLMYTQTRFRPFLCSAFQMFLECLLRCLLPEVNCDPIKNSITSFYRACDTCFIVSESVPMFCHPLLLLLGVPCLVFVMRSTDFMEISVIFLSSSSTKNELSCIYFCAFWRFFFFFFAGLKHARFQSQIYNECIYMHVLKPIVLSKPTSNVVNTVTRFLLLE